MSIPRIQIDEYGTADSCNRRTLQAADAVKDAVNGF